MKYILTLAILAYVLGAFEFIRLVNEFNSDVKHGYLVDSVQKIDANNNNALQHIAKKIDRKPW